MKINHPATLPAVHPTDHKFDYLHYPSGLIAPRVRVGLMASRIDVLSRTSCIRSYVVSYESLGTCRFRSRVARWYIHFHTKNLNFDLLWKESEKFWYILRFFGNVFVVFLCSTV
jgi:hypothetical protein